MAMQNPAGVIPALSSPTKKDGGLDEKSFRSLVDRNIEWGVDGLAITILAGEFYKFSDEERGRLFEVAVDQANGRVPVWAGVNHVGTEPAIALGRHAKDVGAAGVIALPPFVGPKTDAVCHEHFGALLDRVDLPVMAQDSEDFTEVHLRPNLYVELKKEHSNLTSVKIEGGDTLTKIRDVLAVPELRSLSVLGGMGARLLLQELELGTQGTIPGSCLTDLVVRMYREYRAGDKAKAKETYARYRPWLEFFTLNSASSAEVQKETSRLRGIIESSHTRSPHVPLSDAAKARLVELVSAIDPVKGN